jgi:predicted nucleic acid-binding protein
MSARARVTALERLRADLQRLHVVELVPSVVERVHVLLERHPLRAADALQLASALTLADRVGGKTDFVVYDARLAEAARAERLNVLP